MSSTLIIILRPSLAEPNSWKIQINGLTEEQLEELKKTMETIKYKREYTADYVSIRWRIETNRKESVMPISHIAPLVRTFNSWGYELVSCDKGLHYDSDIIFWTLIRPEDIEVDSEEYGSS